MPHAVIPGGFIVIARAVSDSATWTAAGPLGRSLMVNAIGLANWKDGDAMTKTGERITIPRGSLISSWPSLARREGVSVSRIRRAANFLKTATFWDWKPAGKGAGSASLFCIMKYDLYQTIGNYERQAIGQDIDSQPGTMQTGNEQDTNRIRTPSEAGEAVKPESRGSRSDFAPPIQVTPGNGSEHSIARVWNDAHMARYVNPPKLLDRQALAEIARDWGGTEAELAGTIAAYFADDDEWLVKRGHPIKAFRRQADQYTAAAGEAAKTERIHAKLRKAGIQI